MGPISTSAGMGDLVIRKTCFSGIIDRKQTCPDKRIITVDVMYAKEIYTEIKLMSCDALNLLMPDFSGTMLS